MARQDSAGALVGEQGLFFKDGSGNEIEVTPSTPLPITGSTSTTTAIPAAANILVGTAAADNGTIITIPAGRTWQGTVTLSASLSAAPNSPAASATPNVTTSGAGVIPAAGTVVEQLAMSVPLSGATALTGYSVTGAETLPLTVAAPAGNAVTLVLHLGGATAADATAAGLLL